MEKKENTFRDEVEASKVPPAEEMNRNQAVHLVHLQCKKAMLFVDAGHLRMQIGSLEGLMSHIETMDDCECKTATIGIISGQIEQNEKAFRSSQFNGISEMTLDALERLAALSNKPSLLVEKLEEGVN